MKEMNIVIECRNKGDSLILSCSVCGQTNDTPPDIHDAGAFDGAVIAAFDNRVKWDDQRPVPGTCIVVEVLYPFTCRLGECFHVTYEFCQVVKGRLLSILDNKEHSAVVQIEILSVQNQHSFAKRLPHKDLETLESQASYLYEMPSGDAANPWVVQVRENIIYLYNDYGGGDLTLGHTIYTDEDGVDHLVQSAYTDIEHAQAFLVIKYSD